MSESSVEVVNESNVREEICQNCKGKGTTAGTKVKTFFKGIWMLFLAYAIFVMFDGWVSTLFAFIMLFIGVFEIISAQAAKCPVCNGTGKVKLGS